MLRSAMITQIRLAIGSGAATQLSDVELYQAIQSAVSGVNRYFPREVIKTIVWNETITDESVTSSDDTAVSLANKPLTFDSEVVTSDPAGTTYTKDTDYEMDYINGTITTIGAGAISDATGILVSYTIDSTMLDISSLTKPISIERADIRTGSESPRELAGWTLWGDFFLFQSQRQGSGLTDNAHINIYYRAQHDEPTDSASGTFPSFLYKILILGSIWFALLIVSR